MFTAAHQAWLIWLKKYYKANISQYYLYVYMSHTKPMPIHF